MPSLQFVYTTIYRKETREAKKELNAQKKKPN